MSNIIKIKRGSSANLDSVTLQEGELATTTDTRKLYIGNADGTKTELGQQGPQGVRGTKWWVGDFYSQMFDDANNGDLLLNTSETSPGEVLQFYDGMWDSVANIKGPRGPQGEKGEPGESIPVGSIIPYGNSVVPETYLLCNGQAVSRTDYPELFAIIGTSFGSGDGSTTFNVPDYRDKFVLGAGGDVDLAETGGEKEVTLTVDTMPSHGHQLIDTIGNRPQAGWGSGSANNNMISFTATNGMGRYLNAGNTGGGKSHNNMPPYVGTYYIIKAKQSAGVVATVIDNLESTSATDALSAKQGKILNDKISAKKITLIIGDSWTDESETGKNFRDGADSWVIAYREKTDNKVINQAVSGAGFARSGYKTFGEQYMEIINSSQYDNDLIDTIIIYGGINDYDNVSFDLMKSNAATLSNNISTYTPKAKVYCAIYNAPNRELTFDLMNRTSEFINFLSASGWNFVRAAGWNMGVGDTWASDNYHPNEKGEKQILSCILTMLNGGEGISIPLTMFEKSSEISSYTSTLRYVPYTGHLVGEVVCNFSGWTMAANSRTSKYIMFNFGKGLKQTGTYAPQPTGIAASGPAFCFSSTDFQGARDKINFYLNAGSTGNQITVNTISIYVNQYIV